MFLLFILIDESIDFTYICFFIFIALYLKTEIFSFGGLSFFVNSEYSLKFFYQSTLDLADFCFEECVTNLSPIISVNLSFHKYI